jgi:AcrR family transcriptional regulator
MTLAAKGVTGAALRELVLEKLTQKAASFDRSTAKGRLKAEAVGAIADELGALDVWTRIPPSARSPKLTREHIAATALRLADTEGIAALSMRRLASELGVGTMSLYHYIRTKDELLTLVTDAVMGEVVVPTSTTVPNDWRAALTVIAKRTHAACRRHPWMLDVNDDPPIGPNSVRHIDQTLDAVSSLDLSLAERLDIAMLIDEYVFGHAWLERNRHKGAATGHEDSMVDYIAVLIDTGAYPQLEGLAADTSLRTVWREMRRALADDRRFERNLERVLDGIEASLP